jgi:radical SAM/Cys-rich protein
MTEKIILRLLKLIIMMNTFDKKLNEQGCFPLTAGDISTLQVNLGYRCNLRCTHCHVKAAPDRKEEMSLTIISRLLEVLKENEAITSVDITGGSPELNPYYKFFIKSCVDLKKKVTVRTNLAIYDEPGMDDLPEFLTEHKVRIVASLPCYSEEGVDSQRGQGTYKKAVNALKKLNSLRYGEEGSGLVLDIMFNPAGTGIAPDQGMLEKTYREKLREMHGIYFNNLIALSNMPIGRLEKSISEDDRTAYVHELVQKYNPATVDHLMCRNLVSVSPDGTLYDCDFWQMLKLPVKERRSNDIRSFDYGLLSRREILTTPLCFMCTAGAGASCSGALT